LTEAAPLSKHAAHLTDAAVGSAVIVKGGAIQGSGVVDGNGAVEEEAAL
jgi:hypothetical protein